MASLPDDFIVRFGNDRDMAFFPTETFLTWAGQQVFEEEDENGEPVPVFLRKFGSDTELKRLGNDQYQIVMVGTTTDATMDELDAKIIESAGKSVKRKKVKKRHIWDVSQEKEEEPEGGVAFAVESQFDKKPKRKGGFVQKGEGTTAQILGAWTPDGVGITPGGLKAIADDIFAIGNSDTEWFVGFASSPPNLEAVTTFVETSTEPGFDTSTVPEFIYYVHESTVWTDALVGTGGDYMVGKATGAEWFAIANFGAEVEIWDSYTETALLTTTDLISGKATPLMTPKTMSMYLRFDFNFSAADLADTESEAPYDHLFLFRGEPGSACDFVCVLDEPGDGRLNPGARMDVLFNVSAMGVLVV